MCKKKNKDFEGQGLLGLTKKEDEEILKAAEDIFGPADEEDEKKEEELIDAFRCCDCEQVMSICDKCKVPFGEGGHVYCIDTGDNHTVHYCGKCTHSWMITEKGKQHLAGIRENAPELAKEKEELKKAKFERGYIRAKRNSVFHKEQLSESTKETKEIRKSSTVKALTWAERRLWKYPLK